MDSLQDLNCCKLQITQFGIQYTLYFIATVYHVPWVNLGHMESMKPTSIYLSLIVNVQNKVFKLCTSYLSCTQWLHHTKS